MSSGGHFCTQTVQNPFTSQQDPNPTQKDHFFTIGRNQFHTYSFSGWNQWKSDPVVLAHEYYCYLLGVVMSRWLWVLTHCGSVLEYVSGLMWVVGGCGLHTEATSGIRFFLFQIFFLETRSSKHFVVSVSRDFCRAQKIASISPPPGLSMGEEWIFSWPQNLLWGI